MTRKTYTSAKRAACVSCMEKEKRNETRAKTNRSRNNAIKRYQTARRNLEAIDAGRFWNPMREYYYLSVIAFWPETALDTVSAL